MVTLPDFEFVVTDSTPECHDKMLAIFRKYNIPIYPDSVTYSSSYPVIGWDGGEIVGYSLKAVSAWAELGKAYGPKEFLNRFGIGYEWSVSKKHVVNTYLSIVDEIKHLSDCLYARGIQLDDYRNQLSWNPAVDPELEGMPIDMSTMLPPADDTIGKINSIVDIVHASLQKINELRNKL
jgi:hypothetical protein